MSPSARDEARQQREEARRRRRAEPARDEQPETSEDGQSSDAEPENGHSSHATGLDSLRGAATVAAAGAAVGAALGAARALTARAGGDDEDEDVDEGEPRDEAVQVEEPEAAEPDSQQEPEPEPEPQSEAEAEPEPRANEPERREPERPVAGASPDEASDVVDRARSQLLALHGAEPESISSLERTHDGWRATFEVVELRRVPDSTDVLASYEVLLDEDKNVTRYARIRRYYRAQADHEGVG
jgi:hypothetical protein